LIALTGWGQDEDRRRSDEAGFDAHLVKPVDDVVLARLLAELSTGTQRHGADPKGPCTRAVVEGRTDGKLSHDRIPG
jgi:hypothetical protein